MKPQVDGRVLIYGIIVIPPGKRAPYGNDVAVTRRVGGTRASVRGRVGHFAEWPPGHRAVRVSGRTEARASRRIATASPGSGDRAASESRTYTATEMKPFGIGFEDKYCASRRETRC